jgi:tetratricopeptide (TPR) repeat protein
MQLTTIRIMMRLQYLNHAVLGQIVVERADAAQVKTWIADLPQDAKQHPEIWYWLGLWAVQQQDLPSAARCLWETVKLQPNHLEANRRLSQQLKQLGRDEDAKPFAERAAKLELLKPLLDDLYALRENINPDKAMLDKMIQAAEMTEGLGRLWEAWAWYQLVLVVEPKNTRALKQVQRLGAEVSKIAEQVIPDAQPARYVDLGNIPLPDWNAVTPSPES